MAGGAAAAGGAGGALRAGASLVIVDVLTGHICSVSLLVFTCRRSETSTFGLCKAADVQRSGPGPGRRAHEAVQHQIQFLAGSCVVSEKHHHKSTVAGFFTEPLEPDTGKPCENSLKTHLIVPLFFQSECDPKRFDVRSWYEAAKDRQECGS